MAESSLRATHVTRRAKADPGPSAFVEWYSDERNAVAGVPVPERPQLVHDLAPGAGLSSYVVGTTMPVHGRAAVDAVENLHCDLRADFHGACARAVVLLGEEEAGRFRQHGAVDDQPCPHLLELPLVELPGSRELLSSSRERNRLYLVPRAGGALHRAAHGDAESRERVHAGVHLEGLLRGHTEPRFFRDPWKNEGAVRLSRQAKLSQLDISVEGLARVMAELVPDPWGFSTRRVLSSGLEDPARWSTPSRRRPLFASEILAHLHGYRRLLAHVLATSRWPSPQTQGERALRRVRDIQPHAGARQWSTSFRE